MRRLSFVGCAAALAFAGSAAGRVADVREARELARALREGEPNIVLRAHIDFSSAQDQIELPLEVSASTRSIQVRHWWVVQSRCQHS